MEAAAPPTATSSSPCGFLSLLDNLGILQLLPLFFLATFCNASSCLHCSNSKKITAAVFVAVEFSDIKARQGFISGRGIFCTCRATKESYWFLSFFSKLYLSHPTISHWIWSTPLLQICEVMAEEVEKKHNPQICTFSWTGTYFDLLNMFVSL